MFWSVQILGHKPKCARKPHFFSFLKSNEIWTRLTRKFSLSIYRALFPSLTSPKNLGGFCGIWEISRCCCVLSPHVPRRSTAVPVEPPFWERSAPSLWRPNSSLRPCRDLILRHANSGPFLFWKSLPSLSYWFSSPQSHCLCLSSTSRTPRIVGELGLHQE